MNVAIIPPWPVARFRVIDDPVLTLAKGFYKRAVAYTPDLVSFLEDGTMLCPSVGIEDVLGFVVKQAKAVIGCPATAGGVDYKDITVALEDLGSFTNRHRHALPGLVGMGDKDARTGNSRG